MKTLAAATFSILSLMCSSVITTASASTVLTSEINADNVFYEYLSTSPNSLVGATEVASGGYWPTTFTSLANLTGRAVYLIVEVINQGGPGGFLGQFSLSGSGYQFENGSQTLLTGSSDWTQSLGNVNGPYSAAVNEGQNGVGPWGNIVQVSSNADWIWNYSSNGSSDYNTVYFETEITSHVPEPATITLLGMALAAISFSNRRHAV